MSNIFFGFAMSDSMFNSNITLKRVMLTPEQAKAILKMPVQICLNSSHVATIDAMKQRFGIEVAVPNGAPKVELKEVGDSLLVMQVRGLPRLDASRHEYTEEEVNSASFTFSLWTVESTGNEEVVGYLLTREWGEYGQSGCHVDGFYKTRGEALASISQRELDGYTDEYGQYHRTHVTPIKWGHMEERLSYFC